MKVKLLKYTPEPDKICAVAALCCYSQKPSMELINNLGEEKIKKILRKTIGSGHYSVIEHASFTFSVGSVSRALTHQLVRHRIASYSQQSQRYVKLDLPTFVTPPTIEKNKETLDEYNTFMESAWKIYNFLLKNNTAPEDARFVLPNATTTNITVTMNARELIHFFELRCCMRAQWEIRHVALTMLEEVKKVAPVIFENAGPPCENCPELDFPCEMTNKRRKSMKNQ